MIFRSLVYTVYKSSVTGFIDRWRMSEREGGRERSSEIKCVKESKRTRDREKEREIDESEKYSLVC
jgi:hypothetical protein